MSTPRQELIKMSAVRLNRWRSEGYRLLTPNGNTRCPRAEDAVEAVIDECRSCAKGTLGAEMLKYYRKATETAVWRVVLAVDAQADDLGRNLR